MEKKLLKDVTDRAAKRLKINKKDAQVIGNIIFEELANELELGNSVMINEFGLFKNKFTKGRDMSHIIKNSTSDDFFTPKFYFATGVKQRIKNSVNKKKRLARELSDITE